MGVHGGWCTIVPVRVLLLSQACGDEQGHGTSLVLQSRTQHMQPHKLDGDDDRRMCKFWARTGACGNSGCPFRHRIATPWEERQAQRAQLQRQQARAALYSDLDPHAQKAKHGARHQFFVRFVLDTFGLETLRSGCGVLDVAGGRGSVSFQLHCKQGIPCTLLEPRDTYLKSGQRRHLRKAEKRPGTTFTSGAYRHLRARLDEDFEASEEGATLLATCSALVGLHSDEATEPIVRAALRHGKDFAVVPCCVFPTLFDHRQLRNGAPVRTYDQFCEWLLELAPGSEQAFLPFEGRNRVIFRRC